MKTHGYNYNYWQVKVFAHWSCTFVNLVLQRCRCKIKKSMFLDLSNGCKIPHEKHSHKGPIISVLYFSNVKKKIKNSTSWQSLIYVYVWKDGYDIDCVLINLFGVLCKGLLHIHVMTGFTQKDIYFCSCLIQFERLWRGSLCTAPLLRAIVCCNPYDMSGKLLMCKKYRFSMCHSTLRKYVYEMNKIWKLKASFESVLCALQYRTITQSHAFFIK